MKLNLDFYKEDLYYDNLINKDEEEELYQGFFKEENIENWEENIKGIYDFERVSYLIRDQRNLLEWYEFEKDSSALEIGSKFGEITNLLAEKCSKVTAIEFSKNRGEILEKRLKDKENVEVIIGNLLDINFSNEKYDYIVLIGILEYAPLFFKTEKPYNDFINFLKDKLKYNGKFLIAINNSIGIQYLAGNKSEHFGEVFEGLEKDGLDKSKILQIFEETDLEQYKFYYPLPNYKMPSVIFSDEYMPTLYNAKTMYNVLYNKESKIFIDERKLMKKIIKNNLFDKMTNSFFVEVGNYPKFDDAIFISFNCLRKEQYRLMTKLTYNKAEKKYLTEKSREHFNNFITNCEDLRKKGFNILEKTQNEKIISDRKNIIEFDHYLFEVYKKNNNNIELLCREIRKWFENIKQIILNNATENILKEENGLIILKVCYIDMIFQNTFYEDEKYIFFDQEWTMKECPLEYILFRAIKNFLIYYDINITFDEMLKKFELLDKKEEFEKIESEFQKDINDEYRINLFSNPYTYKRSFDVFDILDNETICLKNKIEKLENSNLQLKVEINDLKQELEEKNLEKLSLLKIIKIKMKFKLQKRR